MTNDLKHVIGDASNSEYVLDPEGRIVHMRLWSDPELLRGNLAELVGPVENPTTVTDLDMPTEPPLSEAPTGVVPPLELNGEFHPLLIQAQVETSQHPFYAKLRVGAENALFSEGQGELYLGFFLGPIYDVRWNNEASPVQYEIDVPRGVSIDAAIGDGPLVDVPADSDPREFLLNVIAGPRPSR